MYTSRARAYYPRLILGPEYLNTWGAAWTPTMISVEGVTIIEI